MNIKILGDTAAAGFLAQLLSTYNNVDHVFHFGAGVKAPSHSKYHPTFLFTEETCLDFVKNNVVDLIVPTLPEFNFFKTTNIPTLSNETFLEVDSTSATTVYILVNKINWQVLGSVKNNNKFCYTVPVDTNMLKLIDSYLTNNDVFGIIVFKFFQGQLLGVESKISELEGQTIFSLIDSNLAELFLETATNKKISDIILKQGVSVSLGIFRKTNEVSYDFPHLWPLTDTIQLTYPASFSPLYGVITLTGTTLEDAKEQVGNFINNKYLGQYYYEPF
jgi:hypothetical protein